MEIQRNRTAKLPDKIVFDADRCDGSGLKVGDKIHGIYIVFQAQNIVKT